MFLGIVDIEEEIADPQPGQKRPASGTSALHRAQRVTWCRDAISTGKPPYQGQLETPSGHSYLIGGGTKRGTPSPHDG